MAGDERFDPGGGFEVDRGGAEDAFELVVSFFEVGLVAVGGEGVGVGEVSVVGDQREAAVGGGFCGYRGLVDLPVEGETGLLEAASGDSSGGPGFFSDPFV